MIVKTTYKANASGKGQVVAKGAGRQRTVAWDHSRSAAANHGAAAGTLLLAHNWNVDTLNDHHERHDHVDNGVHVFTLTHKESA